MASFLRRLFGAKSPPSGDAILPEPEATMTRAADELALKTDFAQRTWGLGDGGRWDADLEAGVISFATPKGWTFTAVACHLAGAQGAYRGPSGTSSVFMTYGQVTIVDRPGS